MATLRETAQQFVPPQTLNIADVQKIPVDIELLDGEGKDKETDKVFKYKYAVINAEKYRVAGSIIGGIKALLERQPNLQFVQVLKQGTGMNTRYSVIPFVEQQKKEIKEEQV